MTREANINPFYWSLWAQRRRGSMARTGYPTRVPWYSPPKFGDLYDDREVVTSRDIAVVEDIETALARHRQRRPAEVMALEVWEGAYVDADPDRAARVRESGVGYDACQKAARRAKLAVERYMFTLA